MASNETDPRARAPDTLAHDELRDQTQRLRIAWAETSEGTEPTKRALRVLRDKAREWAPLAIATLADQCRNGKTGAVRIAAAAALLDRAYGKAKEIIEVDDKRAEQQARQRAELEALRKNPDTAAALLQLAEASAKLARRPRD